MNEKQICCCGAACWSRVIGFVEVIMAVISIIEVVHTILDLTMALLSFDNKRNTNKELDKILLPAEKESSEAMLTLATVFAALLLIIAVAAFIMGIVLLRGSYKRNPHQLQTWIVFTIINSVASLVLFIGENLLLVSSKKFQDNIFPTILSLTILLPTQVFCVWVVNVHKKEIQATTEQFECY